MPWLLKEFFWVYLEFGNESLKEVLWLKVWDTKWRGSNPPYGIL